MSAQTTIQNLRAQLTELRNDGNTFMTKVLARKKIHLWTYPKEKMNSSWSLGDLNERTLGAQAVGYTVCIESTDKGIEVYYLEKLPHTRPYNF